MKKLSMMATLLVLASWSVVNAQQEQPSLKPSGSVRAEPLPITLLLEVSYNASLPPGYSSVNGPDEHKKWIWVTKFVRIPGSSQTSPPIRAVKLEPQFNGETTDVRVTLLKGVVGFDQEDLVGVYNLSVGQQRMVKDLLKVGIEPFTVTLLNTVPPIPPPPVFDNSTTSIAIVNVLAENLPKPAYRITFRNLSEKSVLGLKVEVSFDGGGPRSTILYRGEEGHPLIEPGGTVERYLMVVVAQRAPTGFTPATASTNTVHIPTAVFSDLSYEGKVENACYVESILAGQKVWLTQVVPLLERQLGESFVDHIGVARQFKEKFEGLVYDYGDTSKASAISPSCKDVAEHASITTNILKLEMLRDLDPIINTRPKPPLDFRAWIETRLSTYKAWLARL
jgi:hypothetical protein